MATLRNTTISLLRLTGVKTSPNAYDITPETPKPSSTCS
jgi:hypothetical protein